jgi:type I restriction enzyme S subunit
MTNYMTTIGEVAEIYDGPHATPEKIENGPYYLSISSLERGRLDLSKSAFLSESDFQTWTKRVAPQKGDILFSYETRLGEAALMPEGLRACLGRRMGLLRPKINKVTSEYLLYAYIAPQFQQTIVSNTIKGATVERIALNKLSSFNIRIPDFDEQKNVAGLLTSIDSKIEINNRINIELESMAKTLYDYWFVQFDFPDKDGKPYKTSGGKMVWNEELKREIPEGWEVDKIGNIFHTSLGGTPSTRVKEYWENGTINWLNSGEIANFPIIDSELKITEAAIRNSATDLLPKGSVLLSITRHLRPTILAIDACANQSVVGIKEKDDYKCYFLYPYLKNEIPRLNTMRSGAQQPHINKEIVDESFIVIPNESSNIMKAFYANVGHLYELIINNTLQNQTLVELRDWLLPMLMNGQVQVTPSPSIAHDEL